MALADVIQEIEDARLDLKSLEDFIFQPAGVLVARRLAPPVNTLQYYVDSLDSTKAEADSYIATIPTIVNNAIDTAAIANGLADTLVNVTPKFTGAVARTQAAKNKDIINVKDFGAKGDGSTDDTVAIQAAFDSDGFGAIWFPEGLYKISGTGAACLTLSKNRDLYGSGVSTILRADFAGANTSLLKISITDSKGYGDCRGWTLRGLRCFHNQGGKHGLHIEDGMSIVNAQIARTSFAKGTNTDGYGIYIYNKLAHSEICNNEFDGAYLKIFDANVIRKNLTFGKGVAITLDCENGIRNNVVCDNTLVNRDGQVKILNGDNIRITNNQMELAQGYTPVPNQSNPAAMLHLVGIDRPILNTIIENNNFGGGTSLNYSVYVDNAQRTVIDKNQFNAVNLADVHFTAKAEFNVLGNKNLTKGNSINRRDDKLFKTKVVDLGVGNIGVLQSRDKLVLQNGWTGSDFFKTESGSINFLGSFSSSNSVAGDVITQLPKGFTPHFQKDSIKRNLLNYTEDFSNISWLKYAATVSSNVAQAPDGETTADLIVATTTNDKHSLTSPFITLPNDTIISFSVYLKRADATSTDKVRIEVIDTSTAKVARAIVDFTAVTVTPSSTAASIDTPTATITAVNNGFYLVKMSFRIKADNGGSFNATITVNNLSSLTSYTGDASLHKVIAWGAQLEIAATSTGYQRVTEPTFFETVFKSKAVAAFTDSGVGVVNITRQGLVTVGNLPSNTDVSVAPFQAAQIEN